MVVVEIYFLQTTDDLAQQIFNLWMSSPGHKANQMDDYNSHGFIAVMYSQPKAYAGKNYINFSANLFIWKS
mgnify:CR=1 FL=1